MTGRLPYVLINKSANRAQEWRENMIRFILNGKEAVSTAGANERLLDVLRDEFRLTGVKCGCKEGECGACSVILDGRLANSCMVAMGSIEGSSVMTIEGYRETKRFTILDQAYASVSAVQCGFCIPGMILASECILSKNPKPTEEEIREGISGNLCRCTGYNAIVEAIDTAAKEGKGLW
jgi:aerobic carbon-monoxide dehydrogenase small subunit